MKTALRRLAVLGTATALSAGILVGTGVVGSAASTEPTRTTAHSSWDDDDDDDDGCWPIWFACDDDDDDDDHDDDDFDTIWLGIEL